MLIEVYVIWVWSVTKIKVFLYMPRVQSIDEKRK